jgi:formate dehydrogenase iron-sulfur subunit
MEKTKGWSRRSFLKKGGLTALGAVAWRGDGSEASARTGTYGTLIDITRCDGCQGEAIPRCVEACRRVNERQFPVPKEPIRDLWPQKTHDDWSKKKHLIDRLTPYNWTTVQRVEMEGEAIFIPRRCMHCDNPPCARLCPFGALDQYADGSVVINHGLCMGGAKCKAVCPWGIPQRQSGVGLYMKLQPIPAGGGVMYKCDFCHDRLNQGLIPACVEACEKRLGPQRPLFFGRREEIRRMAHARAKEIGGHIYGEEENGGTSTLYVSKIPFEKIHARLRERRMHPSMGKVSNVLNAVNPWAKAFFFGPLFAALGALGLAFVHRKHEKESGREDHGKNHR